MTFQNMIQTLNTFWGEKGCIVGQPYGMEVGAGTGNPSTFFRVLGPEPINIAYIEPSRRPTDGRYGESPNRFQHYFQYQVILKPAPKFNQEMFTESLIALGIDPTKHDIRFVEDNWESAPLGAWGLGWEIWCDGMEVAQYTYFQQMAGSPMKEPVLEITYGLERMAMYIQDVDTYEDLKWNEKTTYSDLFKRHEFWQSKFNFETSTIKSLQILFSTYETEVQTQIEKENFWAAYDNLLKMSHTFNLLDARGLVSSADRVAKFGTMGKFSRAIGTQYLKDRENLGYPFKNKVVEITYKPELTEKHKISKKTKYQDNIAIVELGFEEIPAEYMQEWNNIISHSWFKQILRQHGISYRKAYIYVTPRRIVMKVVQPSSSGKVKETIFGAPTKIAYTADNKPTPALTGFLKKNNAILKDVRVVNHQGREVISIKIVHKKSLTEVLQIAAEMIIGAAPKTKWMMWNAELPAFIRPIRWITAFHNKKSIKIKLMNIVSDRFSMLPRYEKPAKQHLTSAREYLGFIQDFGIILDPKKRISRIANSIGKHSSKPIGKYQQMILKNAYLTENPHAMSIQLPKQYSKLPKELITLILEKNLMFPITEDRKGNIWYHIVANHKRVHKRIEKGYQKVANARLEDGAFYFHQDKATKLEDLEEKLNNISFHPKLGSFSEKKKRIKNYVKIISKELKQPLNKEITRAVELIKNDKATALGNEFPSLEGVIGREYALRDGESQKVASILAEHYLPYELNGAVPKSIEAKIVSLADKIDSLVELVKEEGLPKKNDPFEIRKTVYRILTLIISGEIDLNLLPVFDFKETGDISEFMNTRFKQILLDANIPQWIAHNVAFGTSSNYLVKWNYAKNLAATVEDDEKAKETILEIFKRVKNILKKNSDKLKSIDTSKGLDKPTHKEELPERELREKVSIPLGFGVIYAHELLPLAEILSNFFENTLIMDPDQSVREYRLELLQRTEKLLQGLFAMSFD